VLLSFAYRSPVVERMLADAADAVDVLVDSGAFTVMTRGKRIELGEYVQWLRALPFPCRYLSLDVIGDAAATRVNYQKMRDAGARPMPVVTMGGNMEAELDHYAASADYVAFGGLTQVRGFRAAYAARAVKEAAKRGMKAHLLGYTTYREIKALRPYSCDSSSWASAQRYGNIQLYLGRGRFVTLSRERLAAHPKPEHEAAARALGFTLYDLRFDAAWRGTGAESIATRLNAASHVSGSVEAAQAIGTKIHLACSAQNNWQQLLDAAQRLRQLPGRQAA
jgi:hypothetical protein